MFNTLSTLSFGVKTVKRFDGNIVTFINKAGNFQESEVRSQESNVFPISPSPHLPISLSPHLPIYRVKGVTNLIDLANISE